MNLRGVRESGAFFAVPTYAFMAAILGMCAFGLLRHAFGDLPPVESADLTIVPVPDYEAGVTGLAGAFLLLRAFSSGCATWRCCAAPPRWKQAAGATSTAG